MTAPRVLYVCSAARCGSTLTDMFVGGHPQAASLGEANFLGKALSLDAECTCGARLRGCGAWAQVFEQLRERADLRHDPYALRLWDALAVNQIDRRHQTPARRAAVQLRKGLLALRERLPAGWHERMPLPPGLQRALDNKLALYEAVAARWGVQVVVDSSKNMREAIELQRLWPQQVKVVLVVRDGRGVYLSRRTTGRARQESVQGWLRYYRRALRMAEQALPPSALMKLRYEELAADPAAAGQRLCSFVGLPFDARMLDLAGATRHMVNGNDSRFAAHRGIRLDERWRRQLVGDELAYFERAGGAMNRRLGYL